MAYEKRDGDIAVFKETEKKNEKGPDWKGEALIDGKKYEVAFWAKGNKGTMLAGSIKPAREQRAKPSHDYVADDSDIPF